MQNNKLENQNISSQIFKPSTHYSTVETFMLEQN